MNVTVEINDRQVNAAFRKLTQAGANLRPILTSIGEAMVESTKLRFTDSEAPDGGKWKPISPVTAILRKQNKGGQPLLDTNHLRGSLTYAVGVKDVVIGTNVKYAGTHQFGAKKGQYGRTRRGSPIPWGNVPARPFFGMSRGDKAEIMTILRDALTP
jgi:phage virion morphogenesis protein